MPISYTSKSYDALLGKVTPIDEWREIQELDASSGALCCALCHYSINDCVIHRWNSTSQKCQIMINEDDMRDHDDTIYKPSCSLGVVRAGLVNTVDGRMKFDWEEYAVGPCFDPACVVGESCPTFSKETVEYYKEAGA